MKINSPGVTNRPCLGYIYTKLNNSKKGGEKMKFDRKSIEGITPKEAWEFFVPMNVEEFMVS